jgi:multiple sugar transport system substrate-binding protein
MNVQGLARRLPLLISPLLLAGCLSGASRPGGAASSPGALNGKVTLQFWHTRRGSQEQALQAICTAFEQQNPGVTVTPRYQGNYGELNKKIRASTQAKSLPALTVAYEDQVAEYMKSGTVLPLDSLVTDSTNGLKADELADIPAPYLNGNRYPQFGGQLLSFPFTKSNLVLYYNRTLMAKAGFKTPPQTWSELEKQSAAITAVLGKPAFAFSSDASTLDGMIYSFGGEVLAEDGKHTRFDQPATVKVFELLQRMAKAKTLTEASGDDTASMFGSQLCAFTLNTSAGRVSMEEKVKDSFDWDLAILPHAEGVSPVTVMYGPNVCIFKGTPEADAAAWKFVKYWVSPEVTARWARETGYLPVRKSAVKLPEMVDFYRKNPRAQHVYDVLEHAKGEPTVFGWGEVRSEMEKSVSRVTGLGTSPAAAAVELRKASDQILAQIK